MGITTAICNSFKQEILEGVHASADTYKIALYTDAATLGAATTAYSATNEVSGTGYTAGGETLTGYVSGLSSKYKPTLLFQIHLGQIRLLQPEDA